MRDHDASLGALVYTMHRLVRSTRVFAFSTEVRELTQVLSGLSYKRSLVRMSLALGPAGGGTRIGHSLREFRRGFGRFVHPWTTVVVLSDGWDLGDAELLTREIHGFHDKAHCVVWVNPYVRDTNFRPETTGMRSVLPFIDLLLGPTDFEHASRRGPSGEAL